MFPPFFVWSIQKENDSRKPQKLVGYLSHLNQGMGELYLVGGTPFVCVDSGGKATKTVIHIYYYTYTKDHKRRINRYDTVNIDVNSLCTSLY